MVTRWWKPLHLVPCFPSPSCACSAREAGGRRQGNRLALHLTCVWSGVRTVLLRRPLPALPVNQLPTELTSHRRHCLDLWGERHTHLQLPHIAIGGAKEAETEIIEIATVKCFKLHRNSKTSTIASWGETLVLSSRTITPRPPQAGCHA